MGEKSLLELYGPATDVEDDDILSQVPDDEVDEAALDAWLASQSDDATDEADVDEDATDDDGETDPEPQPQVYDNDFGGQRFWGDVDMFVRSAKGKPIRFAPLSIIRWLYQARALSIHEDELYFLWHDYNDPRCDGVYRHGDDALAAMFRETCWASVPESSIRETILAAHRFMRVHRRNFDINQNAYLCRNDVDEAQYTILIVDPDTGDVTVHDGYVDPHLQVSDRYDLGVVWRDIWDGELTDEEQEAKELVDHLVDGVTQDDPRLALRLLQMSANMISLNKTKVGLPVSMGYDLPGVKNGGNGKSEYWRTITGVFARVAVPAPLSAMHDATGLSRLANKLFWYSDESTPHVDDKTTAMIKSLCQGAETSVNMKFEKYATDIQFASFVFSSNFSINFGAKENGNALERRLRVMPFMADVQHGPHAVPRIRQRILANKLAHQYLLWRLIKARQSFIRGGYEYEPTPPEYGDLTRKMLADTSPVELWLYDAGEDVLTGYRPDWDVPHLIETCVKGKTQRWMVYPLHMSPVAKQYHKNLLSSSVARQTPYVVEASGSTVTTPVMPDVRAVMASDKAFLFASFATWCSENGLQAPGSTVFARMVMQREGVHVRAESHVSTPFGSRTTFLKPIDRKTNIGYAEAVREAQAAREAVREGRTDVVPVTGAPAPVVSEDKFDKLRELAIRLRDIDRIDDDGEAVTVSDFTASLLAHGVLSVFGIIPADRAIRVRNDALDLTDAAPEVRDLVAQLIA